MDKNDPLRRTQPLPDDAPDRRGPSWRFWLEYMGHTIELRPGTVLVGRSSSCHLVLDDGLVSRRHAQFVVGPDSVKIEDFGSVNGVQVNSQRIDGIAVLKSGDRVVIGKQEMVLRATQRTAHVDTAERFTAETLHGISVPQDLVLTPAPRDLPLQREQPSRPEALDLLYGVADKQLALGRGDEAEKVLQSALGNLLSEAHAGTANPRLTARAAEYAVRLADATGRPRWVDYAFDLYNALRRPLPAEVVDQLYEVLRKVSGVNRAALHAYVQMLRASQPSFGPAERFLVQRIEGLERLAALK